MDKPVRGFAPDVLRAFMEHEWRGNVRELEKTVKRMVVLADEGDLLGYDLLPVEMREALPQGHAPAARAGAQGAAGAAAARVPGRTLRSSIAEMEKQVITEALRRNHGNKARVARELGLSYPTLLGRIRAFGLGAGSESA
jgi:two-component system response regulator HydG